MGHKNYSKFSQHFNKNEENKNEVIDGQITIDEILTEEEVSNLNDNDVATIDTNGNLTGIITGCKKLNVRKEANVEADVLCVLNENTELTIDTANSTDTFYKVCTAAGIEGYCMKMFVSVK